MESNETVMEAEEDIQTSNQYGLCEDVIHTREKVVALTSVLAVSGDNILPRKDDDIVLGIKPSNQILEERSCNSESENGALSACGDGQGIVQGNGTGHEETAAANVSNLSQTARENDINVVSELPLVDADPFSGDFRQVDSDNKDNLLVNEPVHSLDGGRVQVVRTDASGASLVSNTSVDADNVNQTAWGNNKNVLSDFLPIDIDASSVSSVHEDDTNQENQSVDVPSVSEDLSTEQVIRTDVSGVSGEESSTFDNDSLNQSTLETDKNLFLELALINVDISHECLQHEDDTSLENQQVPTLSIEKSISKKKTKKKGKKRMSYNKESEENASKKSRDRPNYFFAVQVKNSQIKENVKLIQQHVLSQEKALTAAKIAIPTLHLTLAVMRLTNEEEIENAKTAMISCCQQLKEELIKPLILEFAGLGNFGHRVVFAHVKDGKSLDRLHNVADCIQKHLDALGMVPKGERGFNPHLTIFKLRSSARLWKKGIKRINPTLYEEHKSLEFGEEPVVSLQLLSMDLPADEQGYYQCVKEINFNEL